MNQMVASNIKSPAQCRESIRKGLWTSPTTGMAEGYIQGNVVILPKEDATDFMQYCLNNPKPCPLLGTSEVGQRYLNRLGKEIDLAKDIPQYYLFNGGKKVAELTDVSHIWREDLVAFILGCSFSFEHNLQTAGYPMRHIDLQKNVAMFETNIPTMPSKKFHGNLVVSMRAIKPEALDDVYRICAAYPFAHGTPIHVGDPALIGISDINQPDYGDALALKEDEIPVFWACGVTTQVALANAAPDFHITHAPGHMLITDLKTFSGADGIEVLQSFY